MGILTWKYDFLEVNNNEMTTPAMPIKNWNTAVAAAAAQQRFNTKWSR